MKLKRIVVALAAALVFAPALAVPDAVKADETEIEIDYSIPDPVFAQYLKDEWDRDKDGILTQSEMNGVTEIRISNKDIVTLSGISYFHNIETISLYNCDKLQEVQLDNFPRLEELDLRDNNNSRFRIILTNCPNVTRIDAYRSSLRQIYLNDCPNLEYLDVSSSAAEVLREVTIAACPKVVKAYVESTSVFEGQYYKDYRYIEGDDITYYFSSNNNCNVITEFPSDSVPITPENFPDFYFRRMLLMYYDNWDGFLSPTEVAKVKEIDFSPMPVSDIKGVEFFTELTSLTASMGTISEVDLSHNTKLTNLDLQMNNISSIDLSHNT